MAIALLLRLAPAAVYLASLPFTGRLRPRLRWTYRLLGAAITLVGTAVTVYLAMYGGEQGGITAFFFQYGVISLFVILAAQTAAVHWIMRLETARERRRRLAWVLVALLVVLMVAVAYPRVKKSFSSIDVSTGEAPGMGRVQSVGMRGSKGHLLPGRIRAGSDQANHLINNEKAACLLLSPLRHYPFQRRLVGSKLIWLLSVTLCYAWLRTSHSAAQIPRHPLSQHKS